MNKLKWGALLLALVATGASASDADIKKKVEEGLGVKVESVKATPVKGLFEVVAANNVIYASEDGNYVLSGSLFSLKGKQVTSLTQQRLDDIRLAAIKPFEKSMIVFPAKKQKHVVTVFTDTDCGYCQRLHSHMKEYNDLGITVRYLAFPRAGLNSSSADKLESVWCAKDQQAAMNMAKTRHQVPPLQCANNPVPAHYKLGRELNVNGTPALILDNGAMVPGYLDPQRLEQALDHE
ncbi:bifunctional protein-disulfide isomerase/oxidoreductase DsbC [Gallaecimonas kandeliae]|uniref:bifunctional protein-disulfide isomerase/oxidoreductase DsbC n=1 Tax=Gallaecimonas kandeliae TaxID=3029055 RepID=UPI00264732FD|nr:bifunctional protein-disulfide isomerase/oxidoreductase DsbC [Gallaecimonas kandeliae]WKE66376.1 bifunctional protein-disulfide isomerase/oxidoreductase DsbC [Gallaecimonas kandeliae]